ncbi:MAG TPA: SH3 domain-containing protein [Pyrinomonadaceae bacterium]|jgi:hypothetical protein
MKITISFLFLFAALAFAGAKVNAQDVCTVADPTGTPLNVRAYPTNGRVVAKLNNGTVITVEHYTVDETTGKTWAKIGVRRNRKYIMLGYVLDAYLNCN